MGEALSVAMLHNHLKQVVEETAQRKLKHLYTVSLCHSKVSFNHSEKWIFTMETLHSHFLHQISNISCVIKRYNDS
jgi:hypothetical protein